MKGNISNESVRTYLQEIDLIPKLQPSDEKELFAKYNAYKKAILSIKKTINKCENKEEIEILKGKILELNQKIKTVRQEICKNNMYLVVRIAKRFISIEDPSFLDVVQEGNMCLIKAIDNYFNNTKEKSFKQFVYGIIENHTIEVIYKKSEIISLPIDFYKLIDKIKEVTIILEDKGEKVTPELIASILNVEIKLVIMAQKYAREMVSIDEIVSFDNGYKATIKDYIQDEGILMDEKVEMSTLPEAINKAIQILKLRELQIISLHYGLNGSEELSYVDLANMFNVSKERIRQIAMKALTRVQKHSKDLSLYLR